MQLGASVLSTKLGKLRDDVPKKGGMPDVDAPEGFAKLLPKLPCAVRIGFTSVAMFLVSGGTVVRAVAIFESPVPHLQGLFFFQEEHAQ